MKVLTKVLIARINKALRVASYSIEFEAKSENGWNEDWVLIKRKRIESDERSAEERGYQRRIEEEKKASVFDLMELANPPDEVGGV